MVSLTESKPIKAMWLFALPLLASAIFQQLYNIADTVIVGQFVGEDALAAVGASFPITMVFMAIAFGCNVGCSVIISQLYGGKKMCQMKTAISTCFIAFVILGVVLTGIALLVSTPLMRLLGTPDNIFADSMTYLNIYLAGMAFVFLYNISTGIFTALGDSKTPLLFLIVSSVANIVLDIVFIAVFDMGVAGAAWATVIAQGMSAIGAILTLSARLNKIPCEQSDRFSWTLLKKTAYIAIPSVLQQSFVSIGNLFIQGLVNSFGSSVVAGYTAAIKLNTFTLSCILTMSNAMSSFTAQNIGAGKMERLPQGFKAGMSMALCVALPFFVSFFFFSPQMIKIFLDSQSELALSTGCDFLKMTSPFYFLICLKIVIDGIFRGSGAMKLFMTSTFLDLLLRVVIAYMLTPSMGVMGIWTSWPIGWSMATFVSTFCYFKKWWKPKGAMV